VVACQPVTHLQASPLSKRRQLIWLPPGCHPRQKAGRLAGCTPHSTDTPQAHATHSIHTQTPPGSTDTASDILLLTEAMEVASSCSSAKS
jgi:hypothetical protein